MKSPCFLYLCSGRRGTIRTSALKQPEFSKHLTMNPLSLLKSVLAGIAVIYASPIAEARNTIYMVKGTQVVAKHRVQDVDYMTFELPEGVTDNLPDPAGGATLLLGGGTKVVKVYTGAMTDGCDYTPHIISQWDATSMASTMNLTADDMDHIDECKPADDGRILVTSSYGWAVMLDSSLTPVFYATGTSNAHSAELIDGRWVAVACSTGGDEIRLYDGNRSGLLKQRTPLESAHGVVWMESTQRLYAIGGQTLNVYSLNYRTNPDGTVNANAPELVLEKSITTPQNGLHDLSRVDERTLCVSGKKSRLFDIHDETFTEMPLFNASTALKSVNYSNTLNQVWYTDSTVPEGDYSWSTHTVHFSDNPFGGEDTFTFRVPDLNLYKVRVIDWGQ